MRWMQRRLCTSHPRRRGRRTSAAAAKPPRPRASRSLPTGKHPIHARNAVLLQSSCSARRPHASSGRGDSDPWGRPKTVVQLRKTLKDLTVTVMQRPGRRGMTRGSGRLRGDAIHQFSVWEDPEAMRKRILEEKRALEALLNPEVCLPPISPIAHCPGSARLREAPRAHEDHRQQLLWTDPRLQLRPKR